MQCRQFKPSHTTSSDISSNSTSFPLENSSQRDETFVSAPRRQRWCEMPYHSGRIEVDAHRKAVTAGRRRRRRDGCTSQHTWILLVADSHSVHRKIGARACKVQFL